MTDTTLLPCPFPHEGKEVIRSYWPAKHQYWVHCPCGAMGPICSSREAADAAWNRRDQWRTDWENAPKGDEPLYVYGRLADEPDEPPFKTLVKWDDETEEWIESGGLIFEPTHFISPPAPYQEGNDMSSATNSGSELQTISAGEVVQKARAELRAAIAQSIPTDDQIIMNHVRYAYALLETIK